MHHNKISDHLAKYLKELLEKQKPELVKELFLSQHPDWQKQHSALFAEATQALSKAKQVFKPEFPENPSSSNSQYFTY